MHFPRLALCLVFLHPPSSFAEDLPPPVPPPVSEQTPAEAMVARYSGAPAQPTYLSLQEALALALENNLTLEIEQIDVDVEEARIDEARGEFDPTLNFRAIYESIRNPQNQREFIATQAGLPGDSGTLSRLFQEENVLLEGSLDGKLTTGTQWSLVAETDILKNSLNIRRPPSLFFPEYDTFYGVRLTQPLLRDFGKKIQTSRMSIAATDKRLADLDWNRQLQATVTDITKTYFDLIFALGDEAIKRHSITLARELLEGNQRRVDEGVASPIEVRQAEVAVSVREEALITSRHFFREQQNRLLRQLYRDFDLLHPPRLQPTGILPPDSPDIDKLEILSSALQHRVEYRANLAQIEKQDIQIRFTKNQLLPRVDVVGTFGGNGLTGNLGSATDGSFSREGMQWSTGLVVSMPLGARSERARVETEQLRKKQLVLNLKQIEMDIAVEIDTAVSRIETTRQRLDTASRSARLAERTLEEEQERLVQGVTNSFQILAAQEDVATARTRELAAQADLSKALVELWQSGGMLLPKLGISLEAAAPPVADVSPATE